MAKKRCGRCHEWLPCEAFEKAYDHKKTNRGGLSSYCRQCRSAYLKNWRETRTPEQKERWYQQQRTHRYKKEYGLSGSDIWVLRQEFPCCAVCRSEEDLHVDHCHTTGRVRGILCARCNHALGHAADSPERLRLLASYLEDPPAYTLGLTGTGQDQLELSG